MRSDCGERLPLLRKWDMLRIWTPIRMRRALNHFSLSVVNVYGVIGEMYA